MFWEILCSYCLPLAPSYSGISLELSDGFIYLFSQKRIVWDILGVMPGNRIHFFHPRSIGHILSWLQDLGDVVFLCIHNMGTMYLCYSRQWNKCLTNSSKFYTKKKKIGPIVYHMQSLLDCRFSETGDMTQSFMAFS